jgi:hypothetical protein
LMTLPCGYPCLLPPWQGNKRTIRKQHDSQKQKQNSNHDSNNCRCRERSACLCGVKGRGGCRCGLSCMKDRSRGWGANLQTGSNVGIEGWHCVRPRI